MGFQWLRRYISLCTHSPVPRFIQHHWTFTNLQWTCTGLQFESILEMRTHIDIASIDVVAVVSVVLGIQLHTGALWLKRESISTYYTNLYMYTWAKDVTHMKCSIPYNRKCQRPLNLAVWTQTDHTKILAEFKFGSGASGSFIREHCSLSLEVQGHPFAANLQEIKLAVC